jgi:hypothetical protein
MVPPGDRDPNVTLLGVITACLFVFNLVAAVWLAITVVRLL